MTLDLGALAMVQYPNTQLLIDGRWVDAQSGETLAVFNPATGEAIGAVAKAGRADLHAAAEAAGRGFGRWKALSSYERAKVLRRAADVVRDRADNIAMLMTLEQGKPIAESRAEVLVAADVLDWFAGETPRTYGRLIPARSEQVFQSVIREPVGPVAAFSPWNFPVNQIVRKIGAALAAGCSIIAKCPEEAPASPAALIQAIIDAGVPDGTLGLVYGDPAEISSFLIPHPLIRKISFTGSTAVGRQLAGLAATHMKRMTMELGGHAPVIIAADADIDASVGALVAAKYRNAGQVCVSPTRFLIAEAVYDRFETTFTRAAAKIVVGDGRDVTTGMGPLANGRRLSAIDGLVQDALAQGATLKLGGRRRGNRGNFYEPTVLGRVPTSCRAMNEEPFGPVALLRPFTTLDEAIEEANRLPYGLASYGFTTSAATAKKLFSSIEAGMVSINHMGLAIPETPNGGIKDSGQGAEGGSEAIESYLVSKFTTHLVAEA